MEPEMMAAQEPETVTFEVAMQRLEAIVGEMESARMPLDELLERYEEGTRLVQVCQSKLQAAEQRIEMVARKSTEPPVPTSPPSPRTAPFKTLETDVSLF